MPAASARRNGPQVRARSPQRLCRDIPDFCEIPNARFRKTSSRMSESRLIVSGSDRDWSAITSWTARNANARNVSLLCSNADCTEGERTRSRTRITVATSRRLGVDGGFRHSKYCAILIASTITRSEFMREKCARNAGVSIVSETRPALLSCHQSCSAPTVSAIVAPRAPRGFGLPVVVSRTVRCSVSALTSAPINTTITDSQSQNMNPMMAPREP
jgi:hypothetical protein